MEGKLDGSDNGDIGKSPIRVKPRVCYTKWVQLKKNPEVVENLALHLKKCYSRWLAGRCLHKSVARLQDSKIDFIHSLQVGGRLSEAGGSFCSWKLQVSDIESPLQTVVCTTHWRQKQQCKGDKTSSLIPALHIHTLYFQICFHTRCFGLQLNWLGLMRTVVPKIWKAPGWWRAELETLGRKMA